MRHQPLVNEQRDWMHMGDLVCINDWGPFCRKLTTNPALSTCNVACESDNPHASKAGAAKGLIVLACFLSDPQSPALNKVAGPTYAFSFDIQAQTGPSSGQHIIALSI
eukprot:TRINITY_DN1202_c0_g1_i1.p2 TRINITY_DN1202_c0_g1~~TRINITY_DN1202_c0_g1_i1.p2  ORF type:complete len:108 (+),score=3.64 TRINITY_DN1202_c0_g1_i1:1069-1392(+)